MNERDATPSIKQTIKDALSEQVAMANKRDRSETRKLHEIAIKLPVKRPVTLALIDKIPKIPASNELEKTYWQGRMNTTHYYNRLLTFQKTITNKR